MSCGKEFVDGGVKGRIFCDYHHPKRSSGQYRISQVKLWNEFQKQQGEDGSESEEGEGRENMVGMEAIQSHPTSKYQSAPPAANVVEVERKPEDEWARKQVNIYVFACPPACLPA